MDGISYYVAGDTDVTDEMKALNFDLALIPIGGTYTMNYKEAAEYILELKPQAVIPTHYGEVAGDAQDGEAFKSLIGGEIQVELKIK